MKLPHIENADSTYLEKSKNHIEDLTMPTWALGDLLDLAQRLCSISSSLKPSYSKKRVFIFAGDHGVVEEGVSGYPQEVTQQMVGNFLNGGAAINVLSRHAGAHTHVVDMGVKGDLSKLNHPDFIKEKKIKEGTENFVKSEAMTRAEAESSIQAGIDLALKFDSKTDLFAVGEMGIGNTTPSSAMVSAFLDLPPSEVTGRGTGINSESHKKKIKAIEKALSIHKPNGEDPIDVLQKVGGFEIGGMVGMILGASHLKKPVLIDGLISSVSALLASRLNPKSLDFMIFSHASVEPGHQYICKELGQKPLLNLNMRLGEGSGTPLAMNLIDSATKIISEMATFSSAGVSNQ